MKLEIFIERLVHSSIKHTDYVVIVKKQNPSLMHNVDLHGFLHLEEADRSRAFCTTSM